MPESIRWKPKRDRDGNVIPACWFTDSGYTVAQFRVDKAVTLAVTRSGDRDPFAYTPSRDEVVKLIAADLTSRKGAACEA